MSQLQLHTYFFNCTLHFLLLKNQQLTLIKNNINYYTVHIVMMHCIFKKYYTINNNYQIIYGFTQHCFTVNQLTFASDNPNGLSSTYTIFYLLVQHWVQADTQIAPLFRV